MSLFKADAAFALFVLVSLRNHLGIQLAQLVDHNFAYHPVQIVHWPLQPLA